MLVSGPPGAGKSTLALGLADELRLPLFDRDDFKDVLFDVLGWSDREWSRRVGMASWNLMHLVAERFLGAGASLILESNFDRTSHEGRLVRLAEEHPHTLVEVRCTAEPAVLARRFRKRWEVGGRHPGHVSDQDGMIDEETFFLHLAERDYRPQPGAAHVVDVDTTEPDAVDVDAIVREIADYLRGASIEGFDTKE